MREQNRQCGAVSSAQRFPPMVHKHVSAGWDEVKARGALEPKARVADNSECGKPKAEVKDIWRAETHQFGGGGGGREDNL